MLQQEKTPSNNLGVCKLFSLLERLEYIQEKRENTLKIRTIELLIQKVVIRCQTCSIYSPPLGAALTTNGEQAAFKKMQYCIS